jgi:DNA-binding LacI/PurR family transcriptional regulator
LPVVVPHANFYEERIANFAVLHSDTRLAFGDGIRFLARQGHKRVGTIFRSIRQYHCRGFSTEEYLEFLSYNGLDDAKSLVKYVEYSRDQIIHATRELMLGPTPPTAIACFSDFFAIHVYDALKALRIKIPEEVAVMGFCGYNGGQFLSPSLSTVDLMYDNIAKMSVDVMLKSKEWFNKNQPVSIVTPHRLVPKASTQANMLQQQQK